MKGDGATIKQAIPLTKDAAACAACGRRLRHKLAWAVLIATAACPFAAVTVAQDMPIAGFVPFLPDGPDQATKSLIRIVNVSEQAGSVRVSVINDAAALNANSQPLEIGARQTLHFDSSRLSELVSAGASGVGQRYWRVLLRSDLQLEPRAYARTNGAFAELHESVRGERGLYRVAMFNPGSNLRQVSLLRLVNVDQTGVAQGPRHDTIRGRTMRGLRPVRRDVDCRLRGRVRSRPPTGFGGARA